MRRILPFLLILPLSMSVYAADAAADTKAGAPEAIALDKVPAVVKERVDKESKGGEVKSLAKATEDKKTVYIAEISMSGKVTKVHISEAGKVIKTEDVVAK